MLGVAVKKTLCRFRVQKGVFVDKTHRPPLPDQRTYVHASCDASSVVVHLRRQRTCCLERNALTASICNVCHVAGDCRLISHFD
jgi:hypothetical protein